MKTKHILLLLTILQAINLTVSYCYKISTEVLIFAGGWIGLSYRANILPVFGR